MQGHAERPNVRLDRVRLVLYSFRLITTSAIQSDVPKGLLTAM